MLQGEGCSLQDDRGQRFSQADFSPDLYNGVQQMYTPPSEWTPGRRALPPWPTTRPPPPSPRTTGSPGRCSNSSSRGPKGSSATVYPTLAAVHVYSSSYCLYYTTHYWNISDYRCISLRPHTYVLWCQCQVKFRLGVLHSTMQVLTR